MCDWASGPESEGCSWARGQSGSEQVCVRVCVCVHARRGGLIGGKRIFESRAMTAEGEACVRHVCFAFTPFGAAVCTVLFPEHGNTADVLMVHPPSSPWAAAQGPLCPYLLEMFRFQYFAVLICWGWAEEFNSRIISWANRLKRAPS